MSLVRALRNNNPGNIRADGDHWQGLMDPAHMTPEQKAEKAFCVFENASWGFRAMAVIFHTYQDKHGVTTLRGAISHWAPSSENNTGSYLNRVCQMLSVEPDAKFDFHDRHIMAHLLQAVATVECGSWVFSMTDVLAGLSLAGH